MSEKNETAPALSLTAKTYDAENDGQVVFRQIGLGMQSMLLLELDEERSTEEQLELILHCSRTEFAEAADLLELVAANIRRQLSADGESA